MPNWGEHLLIANKLLKKIKLDEKNVEIPYNQIDIHSK